MSKPLPRAWSLVSESWQFFLKTWNETTKVSMWILYLSLIQFVVGVLVKFSPSLSLLLLPTSLAILVFTYWAWIRLVQHVLALESGSASDLGKEESSRAWSLFLPLIGINLLTALVTLGGFLLFILPGIYLAVCLAFSQLIRIQEGKRGFQALAASRDLVKGRWWATFGRLLLGSAVFGIGATALTVLLVLAVSLFAGPQKFLFALNQNIPDPLVNGIMALIQGIVLAAVLPLLLTYQVKLYRALKASQ